MNDLGIGDRRSAADAGRARRPDSPDRRRHDQRPGHQGRLREDVRDRAAAPPRSSSAKGLARIDDQDAIVAAVREVLDANPQPVAQYRAGKQQTFGFLVGQVMKATKGKANPGAGQRPAAPAAERQTGR